MSQYNQLTTAFQSALGDRNGEDFEHAEYGTTAGWDSMAHMQLITEIETAFDVMLDTDEVISLSSFQKAKEILRTHGVELQA